ncbi:hypothetical protein [Leptodesmis sichuanensis]|nr:hypothetical protein [Leptodesmis sichuanensis]UIE38640.1 hypothetical protein KIK02_03110 [Leptodesmis sichuanensis A121]
MTVAITVHQQAIARHEHCQAEHEARMIRLAAILEATAINRRSGIALR